MFNLIIKDKQKNAVKGKNSINFWCCLCLLVYFISLVCSFICKGGIYFTGNRIFLNLTNQVIFHLFIYQKNKLKQLKRKQVVLS